MSSCPPRTSTSGTRFTAQISVLGRQLALVVITADEVTARLGFHAGGGGSVNLGIIEVGGSFSVSMTLSFSFNIRTKTISGVAFMGSGSFSAWIKHLTCSGWKCIFGSGWRMSSPSSLGSYGITVDTGRGRYCADAYGREFCVNV
jgi:hypothetical protein